MRRQLEPFKTTRHSSEKEVRNERACKITYNPHCCPIEKTNAFSAELYILDAATCLKVGALETYSNPQFSCHFRYHHEVDISATSSPGVGRA
jgi:hypothetical protein